MDPIIRDPIKRHLLYNFILLEKKFVKQILNFSEFFSQPTLSTTAGTATTTTQGTHVTKTPTTSPTTTKAKNATTPTKIQAVHKGWQCPNCTLVNDDTRPGCAACATERPQAEGAAAKEVAKDEPEVKLG